jgi:hypothetical protein
MTNINYIKYDYWKVTQFEITQFEAFNGKKIPTKNRSY